jgi:sulfhydrogenase subunit beta (sulfur reductase)
MHFIEHKDFHQLFTALHGRGYTVIGPTVRDGAIVLDTITQESELPAGWTDVQLGGEYRLERRSDNALFGYVVGPHSWKRYLYQPRVRLFSATRSGKDFTVVTGSDERVRTAPKYAFLGVRPCEIAAIAIQDKVFMEGDYVDPGYAALRKAALVVAVNCVQPGGTCFCTSMETGPRASSGYDLALTEVIGSGAHYFIVDVGSPRGEEVLGAVTHRDASKQELAVVDDILAEAAEKMGRTLVREGLKQVLYDSFDHPAWDDVTKRCLTCTNCTMVCPTCFCSTVEDTTDLSGAQAERWRRWDSCFTLEYAKVAGGNTRPSPRARYRQWLTHKLGYWNDQFGVSGCVGCGRCITWCPVGIDITAEAAAIRGTTTVASDGASARHPKA